MVGTLGDLAAGTWLLGVIFAQSPAVGGIGTLGPYIFALSSHAVKASFPHSETLDNNNV
jgi:hypothetical protein